MGPEKDGGEGGETGAEEALGERCVECVEICTVYIGGLKWAGEE